MYLLRLYCNTRSVSLAWRENDDTFFFLPPTHPLELKFAFFQLLRIYHVHSTRKNPHPSSRLDLENEKNEKKSLFGMEKSHNLFKPVLFLPFTLLLLQHYDFLGLHCHHGHNSRVKSSLRVPRGRGCLD